MHRVTRRIRRAPGWIEPKLLELDADDAGGRRVVQRVLVFHVLKHLHEIDLAIDASQQAIALDPGSAEFKGRLKKYEQAKNNQELRRR